MGMERVPEEFVHATDAPDEEIDVARAALLIAKTEYPHLDLAGELGLLESLAAGASRRLGAERDAYFSANTLSEYLFDELEFRGNVEDYYDPRNSFLNEVLGLPFVGVGMPGHFLVGHLNVDNLFVDPFNGGILLSAEECAQRLRDVTQSTVPWDSRYLTPVGNREFIARILRNLKAAYIRRDDHARAVMMIDWLLALHPEAADERRDRGLAHYRLGHYAEALDDLQGYLHSAPHSSDMNALRELVGHLQRLVND